MRALRVLAAVLVVSRAAEPGAEPEGDEELASWLEALASRGPELPPAAFLGLRLPYERPAGGRPLRGPDRARPVVPPQWSADMLFDGDSMGMNSTGGVGRYLYDRDHQRNRMTYEASMNYFRLNQTQFRDTLTAHGKRQMTYGEGKDGACMDFQGGPRRSSVTDPWAWLFVAAHKGTREAYDGTCDVWRAKVPGFFGVQGSVEACFGADGAARDVTQSFSGRGWGFQQSMVFSNVSVGPLPDEAFAPSYACAENFPAVPCEGRGVETLQLYRIGGAEPLELRSRNTGDDLGDLSFLCTQDSGAQYQQKLVTWWSVEVNTSYGQYALCNFNGTRNVCSSGALDRVGRRGSQMAGDGPVLGQCSGNRDVGSQYSFPEAAECPAGVHPGPGARCSWGFARPLRTIEAECVMGQRGLLEACRSEMGHAPFVKAQHIFRAAFESDDPSKGGCPDAPPSAASAPPPAQPIASPAPRPQLQLVV